MRSGPSEEVLALGTTLEFERRAVTGGESRLLALKCSSATCSGRVNRCSEEGRRSTRCVAARGLVHGCSLQRRYSLPRTPLLINIRNEHYG